MAAHTWSGADLRTVVDFRVPLELVTAHNEETSMNTRVALLRLSDDDFDRAPGRPA
ncbi:hypothetical protein [Streptomyces sp. NPDC001292]|uniref:hypothetical protein n=1 Tax=Streptomyces sp. NPDC001292 TaxID=3364558 RepID=UPI0036C12E25